MTASVRILSASVHRPARGRVDERPAAVAVHVDRGLASGRVDEAHLTPAEALRLASQLLTAALALMGEQ